MDSSPRQTLPTASVDGSEMSISPWTTIGKSPNAIRAMITNVFAEASRLTGFRKYGERVEDQSAARITSRTRKNSHAWRRTNVMPAPP